MRATGTLVTEVKVAPSDDSGAREPYPLRLLKSFLLFARSELRVFIFVVAIAASYLIASGLKPNLLDFALLLTSGYLLSLGVYALNDYTDIEEDIINSPTRPLPSGAIRRRDAKVLILILLIAAPIIGSLISITTGALYVATVFLGIAYSYPRIHAKRRFPDKMLVSGAGYTTFTLAGGAAAQNLNPTIFFAAVSFTLFGMVTLLLGDIADYKGDSAAGVKSLAVVVGPQRAVWITTMIPLVIGILGVMFFKMVNFNMLFPLVLVSLSIYSILTIHRLVRKYDDPAEVRRAKSRLRFIHFALQVSFVIGLLVI